MTGPQRWILIGTLTLTAVFLHRALCEWESGEVFQHSKYDREDLVPISFDRGIAARSRETYGFDAVFGLAVPMMLVGAALFVFAIPDQDEIEQRSDG